MLRLDCSFAGLGVDEGVGCCVEDWGVEGKIVGNGIDISVFGDVALGLGVGFEVAFGVCVGVVGEGEGVAISAFVTLNNI